MANRDYYEVLGVTRAAADHDIRKAFRDLAKRYHPDRNPGDAEAERVFKEINEAYDALKDANKRAVYNHHLETEAEESSPGPEPTNSFWHGFAAVVIMMLVLGGASYLYYVFWLSHNVQESFDKRKDQEQLGRKFKTAPMTNERLPGVSSPAQAHVDPVANNAPAAAESESVLSARAWEKVRESDDILALEDFLEKHRNSAQFSDARSRLYRLVSVSEDVMALEALAQLAQSKVSSDLETPDLARKRIEELRAVKVARAKDDAEWTDAEAKGDAESVLGYLKERPGGQHAQSARDRLARLGLVEVHMGSKGGEARSTEAEPDSKEQDRKGWFTAGEGQGFRDCAKCPEMVIVPQGEYKMGSPESEEGRGQSEGPRHEVKVGKPFAIGKFEVTFDEWDACVAGGGCRGYNPTGPDAERGRRPVSNVSWDDAQAYVQWLRGRTGKPYRLPSEAEWEYVARAGTDTPYWWGAHVSPGQVNYVGERGERGERGGAAAAHPSNVETFEPNRWGLHQVAGNVWEWIEDCWHDTYRGAPADGRPWREENGGDCQQRLLRGGSWMSGAGGVRSAHRGRLNAGMRDLTYGLRVARDM